MKDFDAIKEMWQQQPPAEKNNIDLPSLSKKTADAKTKLMRQQLRGGLVLVFTAIYITWIGFFSSIHFKLTITYIAMLMMLAVILVQAAVCLYTYKKVKTINDTLPPVAHLQQWEDYYVFRKKQARLNMPLYFIFLNIAFGMYFIEVLGGRSFFWNAVVLSVYAAWVLFAYFVLGKRTLAKEETRIKSIIDNLKVLEQQLKTKE